MTELSAALHALVERPLAGPSPMDMVAARSQRARLRRRRRRVGSATALVALVAGVGGLLVRHEPSTTTVAVSSAGSQSASYLAAAAGGYEAAGTWRLTIVRHGHTIEYTSESSPRCGTVGTIQPGDAVRGEIHGEDSVLRVGDTAHC